VFVDAEMGQDDEALELALLIAPMHHNNSW
jgi:hypothetical protein